MKQLLLLLLLLIPFSIFASGSPAPKIKTDKIQLEFIEREYKFRDWLSFNIFSRIKIKINFDFDRISGIRVTDLNVKLRFCVNRVDELYPRTGMGSYTANPNKGTLLFKDTHISGLTLVIPMACVLPTNKEGLHYIELEVSVRQNQQIYYNSFILTEEQGLI